jgi:hypothetical protein
MLQWKPRLAVPMAVLLLLVAAALGQLTWDGVDQLTW